MLTAIITVLFLTFSCMTIHAQNTLDLTPTNTDNTHTNQSKMIQNDTIPKIEDEIQTSYLTTTERTILKSIIETFWTLLKENNKNNQTEDYQVDYYELGKIMCDLLLVDEIFPKDKNSLTQSVIELLIPKATAIILVKKIRGRDVTNYKALATEVATKLFLKLLMVRFFQTPGTDAHEIANIAAFFSTFIHPNPGSRLSKHISIQNAAEKIPLDLLRTFIQSKNVKFGSFFDKKPRKKAIAKTMQVLLHPTLHIMTTQIGNFILDNLPTIEGS